MDTNENTAPKVQELAPGLTIEEIRAIFFDASALREPPYRVYQINQDGHRYYYRYDESGELCLFPSVTTLLRQTMPTPPQLIEWIAKNGMDGATEKRDLAAAYGTFMHGQFETLIINRRYNFDDVPGILLAYMERENLPEKFFGDNLTKARKDVLAFAQFVKDYNVKPLAVEIALVHPEHHYAGCIDLPCIMTDPKTGEKFTAIVDFKSGRKGFFEDHELQLHLYREMWNVNFPDIPVARVFNFSPKDWRTKPTYNLKDQTDSNNAKKIPYILGLAAIEDEKRDNTLTIIRGTLDLDKGKIADNIKTVTLAELIKGKSAAKDTPEQAATAPEPTKKEDAPAKADKKPVKRAASSKTDNVSSEAQKPVKPENDEKLPWENEQEPDKPAGPTPEQLAEQKQQAEKDNLLNFEMEL